MTDYVVVLSSFAKLFLALAAIVFSLSSSNVYLFYIATKPVKFPYKFQVLEMKQQSDSFLLNVSSVPWFFELCSKWSGV